MVNPYKQTQTTNKFFYCQTQIRIWVLRQDSIFLLNDNKRNNIIDQQLIRVPKNQQKGSNLGLVLMLTSSSNWGEKDSYMGKLGLGHGIDLMDLSRHCK